MGNKIILKLDQYFKFHFLPKDQIDRQKNDFFIFLSILTGKTIEKVNLKVYTTFILKMLGVF